jgi:hypothetical protein
VKPLRLREEQLQKEQDRKLGELDILQRTLQSTSSVETAKLKTLEAAVAAKEREIFERDQMLKKVKEGLDGFTVDGKAVVDIVGLSNFNPSVAPVPTQPKEKETPTFDKDGFMKEVTTMFTSNAQVLARLPFDLSKYQQEYHSLTGKPFDTAEFYEKVTKDGTGDYNNVYLREYDIENLRAQKQRSLIEAEIEKKYQEKLDVELANRLQPQKGGRPAESAFFNAVDSAIPKDYKDPNTGNGLTDRSSVISEAVLDFQNRRKEASV